jgi:hypothetical protein
MKENFTIINIDDTAQPGRINVMVSEQMTVTTTGDTRFLDEAESHLQPTTDPTTNRLEITPEIVTAEFSSNVMFFGDAEAAALRLRLMALKMNLLCGGRYEPTE